MSRGSLVGQGRNGFYWNTYRGFLTSLALLNCVLSCWRWIGLVSRDVKLDLFLGFVCLAIDGFYGLACVV